MDRSLPLFALVACLVACDSSDDDPDRDAGTSSRNLSCLDVLECAADCTAVGCEDRCVERGTAAAQDQVTALVSCVSAAGCSDASLACIQSNCGAELTSCTGEGTDGGVGGTDGSSFSGTIGGRSLDVADSLFFVPTASNGDQGVLIMLGSAPGLCSATQDNRIAPDSTGLLLQLYALEGDDLVEPTPGTYTIGLSVATGKSAMATFHEADFACTPSNTPIESGTVTLTRISATRAVGTFTLSAGGSSASGSFDAVYCDLSNQATGEPTCP